MGGNRLGGRRVWNAGRKEEVGGSGVESFKTLLRLWRCLLLTHPVRSCFRNRALRFWNQTCVKAETINTSHVHNIVAYIITYEAKVRSYMQVKCVCMSMYVQGVCEYTALNTWILSSLMPSLLAISSRRNTSGYWVCANTSSSWSS